MSVAAIAKGLATFAVPPQWLNRSKGRTLSARYCYSVFMRHLVWLHAVGADTDPETVAEIGPGASIGTGLAALIAGAERYHGFDIKAYGSSPHNIAVFDELVALFKARAPIPGTDEFATIKPALDTTAFPAHIFDDSRLSRALAPARLERLRRALTSEGMAAPNAAVTYVAPWFDDSRVQPASVDWIFSQAVMEHVDDLERTYAACRAWLRPGALMSHQIDFKSHGTATRWNGHWAYSDLAWRMVRGARSYLINRAPHSEHLEALGTAGFQVLEDLRIFRHDGLPPARLARPYRDLDSDDLTTAGAFIIARAPG
jgi:SAM-dependent methyltransferase